MSLCRCVFDRLHSRLRLCQSPVPYCRHSTRPRPKAAVVSTCHRGKAPSSELEMPPTCVPPRWPAAAGVRVRPCRPRAPPFTGSQRHSHLLGTSPCSPDGETSDPARVKSTPKPSLPSLLACLRACLSDQPLACPRCPQYDPPAFSSSLHSPRRLPAPAISLWLSPHFRSLPASR